MDYKAISQGFHANIKSDREWMRWRSPPIKISSRENHQAFYQALRDPECRYSAGFDIFSALPIYS